jgi:hypothetical protein
MRWTGWVTGVLVGEGGVVRLARSGGGKHNWTWIEACFCV